jgi:GYF domain 2
VIDGRVQPPTITVGDVTAAAPAASADAATASTSSTGTTYTIDFGESDQRQLTLEEVVTSYNDGYITPETFVWADGMSDWTPLGQIPEIVEALNTVAKAAAVPAPASVPQPQVVSTVPRASAAKTTRTQGRGTADLFGSIAQAGSEEDLAQQATHEPVAPVTTTGARNESSVLFSLSALTASAKPTSSATSSLGVSSPSAAKEDSGLIDLKALTSQASNASTAAPNAVGLVAPAPLGGLGGGLGAPLGGLGAPLGGNAPVSAGLGVAPLADYSYPQKKSRMGLYILGAAGIIGAAIVLAIVLQPAPPPPVKVEPTPIAAPKPTPPEPEPIKPAVTEAKPPATGEAAASASAAAAPAKPTTPGKWRAPAAKKPGGGTPSGADKPSAPSGGDAPAPKKPASSSGKCGCAPGDLGCAMRCAAKGG